MPPSTELRQLRRSFRCYFSPTPLGHTAANTVIRNSLISGNRQNGVLISGLAVHDSRVVSNFIGTTAAGSAALLSIDFQTCLNNPQLALGVFIKNGAANNVIEANLISGNCSGVVIDASGLTAPYNDTTARRTYNQVLGNQIGTDSTGASLVPNQMYGVLINNASNNAVASTASGTGNVISGNFYAVAIKTTNQQIAARDNQVMNNQIGTNAAGAELGNSHTGMLLSGFLTGTAISGNVVANNPSNGIKLSTVSLPTNPNGPQYNFLQNNTVSNNGNNGIFMESGAIGNTAQSNTALGNGNWDLIDDNYNASSCPNTWITNTFVKAGGLGKSCIQ